jgi:hypothetical protein
MALGRWQATIVNGSGDVQAGASVEVREETGGSPLASLFSDRDGATPLGNPITADSDGFVFFHVAGGAYRIEATLGAFSRIWRYVAVGTAAERDVEAFVSPAGGTVTDGQLAVFVGTDGATITGALDDASPPAPITSADLLTGAALPDASESARGLVEMATDAEIRSAATGAKAVMAQDLETASAFVALTETSGAVAVDWDAFINGEVTVDQATVISNPTNGQPGTFRTILVKGNDGTDRTITFGNQFLGEVPTITDADSGRWYLLTIMCITATHFVVSSKRALG